MKAARRHPHVFSGARIEERKEEREDNESKWKCSGVGAKSLWKQALKAATFRCNNILAESERLRVKRISYPVCPLEVYRRRIQSLFFLQLGWKKTGTCRSVLTQITLTFSSPSFLSRKVGKARGGKLVSFPSTNARISRYSGLHF